MLFGLLAALCILISGYMLFSHKYFRSFLAGIAAAVFTCIAGYQWRLLLIESGKNPALFGFRQYPAALVIFSIWILLSVFVVIISVAGILINRRNV